MTRRCHITVARMDSSPLKTPQIQNSPPQTPGKMNDGTSGKSTCGSPVSSKKRGRGHHVHWAPKIRVHEYLHIEDIPKATVKDLWYNSIDFQRIKHSNTQTLRLMMKGLANVTSDELHCTRGLESRTKAGHRRKVAIKTATLYAVLDCQEDLEQLEGGIFSAEGEQTLARTYQQAGAVESQTVALIQGLKDEQEVRNMAMEEKEAMASSSKAVESPFDFSGPIAEEDDLHDSLLEPGAIPPQQENETGPIGRRLVLSMAA